MINFYYEKILGKNAMGKISILSLMSFFLIFSACQKQKDPGILKEASVLIEKSTVNEQDEVKPFLKNDGKKWRVLVIQSGEYYSYTDTFKSILSAMINAGWINEITLPSDKNTLMKDILNVINTSSEYLEFNSADLFFDFNWEDTKAKSPDFIKKIQSKNIDLIIGLGTLAGQVLSSFHDQDFQTPVLIDSVSDPIEAGMIASNEDSGKNYLTVRCDPGAYLRQIKLFYDVVRFKKLGIIYTNTPTGKSYAALKDVEATALEKKFEVVANTNAIEDPPEKEIPLAEAQYLKALEELCPKVDALYLTIQAGLTENNIKNVMTIINKYKIPTFAMEGSMFVKKGVLFGISDNEMKSTGVYNLKKIVQIFKGKKPRSLNQIFEDFPYIAINLKAAELIDYDIPIDIIGSSDEIYTTID
ncbi:MAG TPA: hypothetical protein DHW82_12225 [Spirochaetia bacterium]|nr:hypothetical protein [Spirochaetia bacterium]